MLVWFPYWVKKWQTSCAKSCHISSADWLEKEIVEEISRMKEEPQWMLDFRLKSFKDCIYRSKRYAWARIPALPALIIGAAPFYARMVEIALREVDKGVVEAAYSMGASNLRIIWKVLLPESMPALISGITVRWLMKRYVS